MVLFWFCFADDTSHSLSKDIGSAVAGVSELGFDTDNTFQLDDELKLGPLSLDGLNMLSDPDMVLPDPTIEDSFRSDKLWSRLPIGVQAASFIS